MKIGSEQERVTVGCGTRNELAGDDRIAARTIVDNDYLAEILLQVIGERARRDIGAAARRKWYDDANRTRRVSLSRKST